MAEGRDVCVQPSLLLILLDSLDEAEGEAAPEQG